VVRGEFVSFTRTENHPESYRDKFQFSNSPINELTNHQSTNHQLTNHQSTEN